MILNKDKEEFFFKNKKILITGSSGFIGKNLVEDLSKFNCNIFAIYNNSKASFKKKNVKFLKYDLSKILPSKIISSKIDILIHLAGPRADRKSMDNDNAILKSLLIDKNIIDFAIKKKISTFFFASSAGVYNITKTTFEEKKLPISLNSDGVYGLNKLISEKMIYNTFNKTKIIICRFFSIYGRQSNTIINHWKKKIQKNENVSIWGDGNTQRSWLHIDDVINGIKKMLIIKHNKIFFNLGSSEKLSLTKTFHLIKNKYPKSKSKIVFNKSILTGPKKRFTNCKNLKKIGWNQKIKLNQGINLI